MENQSEVARLLRQIDAEYEAAMHGLTGLAEGTARHDFIEARMDRIGLFHLQLQEILGEQESIRCIYEQESSVGETGYGKAR